MLPNKNEYDLVIVGAGLSGMAAATEAAEHHLSTLLIEKGRTIGGTGNYVEGMFAVESEYQKEHHISVTKKQILEIEQNFTHHTADMRIWKDYVDKSASNIEWMKKHGVKFGKMRNLGTKGLLVWHIFKDHGKGAIQDGLEPFVRKHGVDIITSVSAKKLQLDANNTISGVVIEDYLSKQIKFIRTNNVILATGGFLNNSKLIDKLTDYSSKRVTAMNSGKNNGDGLRLAYAVGAYQAMGFVMSSGGSLKDDQTPAYIFRGTDLNNAATREGVLWVNQVGDRFTNEDTSANWGVGGRSLARQFRSFAIMDQKQINSFVTEGAPISNKKYLDLKQQIKTALQKNAPYIHQADNIEQLAKNINLPNLVNTVNHYNKMCHQKKDTDLYKDARMLYSIEEGPFYAIEFNDVAFCAAGGLRTNPQNQVLDINGYAIHGLYAIGNDAANAITGDSYDVVVSGAEAGYCIYSGRNAVQTIDDLS